MPDELFLSDTVVELAHGDITKWKGDAIVNAANTELVMGAGVAAAIAHRAGATVQREALEKAPLKVGEATRTRAGLLPAKFIIHAAVMNADRKTDAAIIGRAATAALANAEAIGLKSIAFPALGTGVGTLPYDVAARAMFDAVSAYVKHRQVARLKKIVFVLFDQHAYDAFKNVLETYGHG